MAIKQLEILARVVQTRIRLITRGNSSSQGLTVVRPVLLVLSAVIEARLPVLEVLNHVEPGLPVLKGVVHHVQKCSIVFNSVHTRVRHSILKKSWTPACNTTGLRHAKVN